MQAPIEEVSTITAKGQTTVPRAIRQALGVGYGGRIAFRVERGGVTVRRADEEEGDPALGPFLDLLARDMRDQPEALVELDDAWLARLSAVVGDADIDLDAPIEGEVDI